MLSKITRSGAAFAAVSLWATAATAQESGQAAIAAGPVLPHDYSFQGMVLGADPIVQAVMAGLGFASVLTWTLLIAKIVEFFGLRRSLMRARVRVFQAYSLEEAARYTPRGGAVGELVAAAMEEVTASAGLPAAGIKERIAARLHRLELAAGRRAQRGIGLLATIGATAPFVGLFGTVWGIMDSFIDISRAETTNLAIVAPGIAEALLATGIGLVAAIPAVVIYNLFSRLTSAYRAGLGDVSAELLRLASRDLDRARPRSLAAAE